MHRSSVLLSRLIKGLGKSEEAFTTHPSRMDRRYWKLEAS